MCFDLHVSESSHKMMALDEKTIICFQHDSETSMHELPAGYSSIE